VWPDDDCADRSHDDAATTVPMDVSVEDDDTKFDHRIFEINATTLALARESLLCIEPTSVHSRRRNCLAVSASRCRADPESCYKHWSRGEFSCFWMLFASANGRQIVLSCIRSLSLNIYLSLVKKVKLSLVNYGTLHLRLTTFEAIDKT